MHRLFLRISLVCLLALVGLVTAARSARAEGLEGQWSMSPMGESYTVQKWVPACGSAPVSGNAGGGGTVNVYAQGDELVISGARTFRTNQCWDPMPTLSVAVHSRNPSGRAWSTRCATPPADPRRANITTNVTATSDTQMQIIETGRYEIKLADGECIADVRRSAFLSRAAPAAPSASTAPPASASAPPANTTPPPSPTPAVDCSSPGEPARLEVRPSRKLMRPGETFTFRASVSDARGCPTPTQTTWALDAAAAKRATIDAMGKLVVAEGATEGTFEIAVTAAGKSTKVSVEVASPARYDALLAQSGLNERGEKEEAAVAILATGTIGSGESRAEDGSRRRRMVFIGVVGGVLVILGGLVVLGVARSRKAARLEREAEARHAERVHDFEQRQRQREAAHAAQLQAHLVSVRRAQEEAARAASPHEGEMVCPACRTEYPTGSVFCPQDANRLIPLAGHEDVLTGPAGGVCPACRRGFNPGIKACPHDGEELVPLALWEAQKGKEQPRLRGKICPNCGERFDGSAGFCGKDGTALVLIN